MSFRRLLFRLVISLLLLTITWGCVNVFSTADLRTEAAMSADGAAKARTLLQQMGAAHRIDAWDQAQTYTATFTDKFNGFIGKRTKPFPDDSTTLQLSYIPQTFDGRLTILDGKFKGKQWGIQAWQTYTQTEGEAPTFEENKDAKFWVPTYQYFIEFPNRIQQATAVAYAGEATINGIVCEGVIASWDTVAPQREVDQYLIWLNKSDHKIVKLEYTIREYGRSLAGAASFKDYKQFEGLTLPTYLPVESPLVKKGYLHEMRLVDLTFDQVPVSAIRVRGNLPNMGDQKVGS